MAAMWVQENDGESPKHAGKGRGGEGGFKKMRMSALCVCVNVKPLSAVYSNPKRTEEPGAGNVHVYMCETLTRAHGLTSYMSRPPVGVAGVSTIQ